ncbi:MAG: fructosamine kinase family protein [Bacteroidota bacterium]
MRLQQVIQHIEDVSGIRIHRYQPVSGGDINQAFRVTTKEGAPLFLKHHEHPPEGMFEAEARGLDLLHAANSGLVIPSVIACSAHYLLLEWIEEEPRSETSSKALGVGLVQLHKTTDPCFGLDHDNYIGRLNQVNTSTEDWADFFIRFRIEPQLKQAIDSSLLPSSLINNLDTLSARMPHLFPEEPPALLHGDLWSGNYFGTTNGRASVFDPAVYFGHREVDIAMTRLFGGFSSVFYQAYQAAYPLESGWEQRLELWNLYPILVHVNLFGGGYTSQAQRILKTYG